MKKIPTLYEREFEHHRVVKILNKVTDGCEDVASGKGVATIKYDGACCAIIEGLLYKRYDAKKGRPVPEGAIKCQEEADPITGHFPCWVKCDRTNPYDKWFYSAYDNTEKPLENGTYEAIGKHFQTNSYGLENDILIRHGQKIVEVGRTIEELKEFLSSNYVEGIVFWVDGEPKCKIKRSDFGLEWGGSVSEL